MKFTALYLLAIVGINFGFEHVPVVLLPNGDVWPPMSVAAGTVFILRDFCQHEIGHRVLGVMVLGALASFVLASPAVAVASLFAFTISELMDWILFSFTRWPFRQRVWISSVVSAPIDSVIFLWAIGAHSVTAVILMTFSKFLGIAVLASLRFDEART